MTNVTAYLKNLIDNAYDPDFISSMDDMIHADITADRILATHYSNADYQYLKAYANVKRSDIIFHL